MASDEVAAAWTRVDAWLAANAPEIGASLGPPASPDDLDAAHAAGMPTELLASFEIHSGQRGERAQDEGHSLMTVSESLAMRTGLCQLNGEFADEYAAIGATYFADTWFPFLDDKAGQCVCVDSSSGEVVVFVHDQPDRPRVGSSLGSFLSQVAMAMEGGECTVDDLGVYLRDGHPLQRRLCGDEGP